MVVSFSRGQQLQCLDRIQPSLLLCTMRLEPTLAKQVGGALHVSSYLVRYDRNPDMSYTHRHLMLQKRAGSPHSPIYLPHFEGATGCRGRSTPKNHGHLCDRRVVPGLRHKSGWRFSRLEGEISQEEALASSGVGHLIEVSQECHQKA